MRQDNVKRYPVTAFEHCPPFSVDGRGSLMRGLIDKSMDDYRHGQSACHYQREGR